MLAAFPRLFASLLCLALAPAPGIAQEADQKTSKPATLPSEIAPVKTDATAAKLVDLHLQARGGVEALRAIESLHLRGTLEEGKTVYQTQWWWSAPEAFRVEQQREHLGRTQHHVRAAADAEGWRQVLEPETERAVRMAPGERQALMWDGTTTALLFRHLVDWREAGYILAFEGETTFRGRQTYLVKARWPDGAVVFYYLDKSTFLLRALGVRDNFAGTAVNADLIPTGARRIDGAIIETGWDWRVDGRTYRAVRFSTIDANPALERSLFTFPAQREVWLRQKD